MSTRHVDYRTIPTQSYRTTRPILHGLVCAMVSSYWNNHGGDDMDYVLIIVVDDGTVAFALGFKRLTHLICRIWNILESVRELFLNRLGVMRSGIGITSHCSVRTASSAGV